MSQYTDKEINLHCDIRSVLQSHKGGLPLHQLEGDFRHLIGHGIPYKEFGHKTLESYLKSIPSVAYVYKNKLGSILVEAVADDSTVHIAKLVERQKTSKKSRIKIRPSGRRPVFSSKGSGKSSYRQDTNVNRSITFPSQPNAGFYSSASSERTILFPSKVKSPVEKSTINPPTVTKQSNNALERISLKSTVKPGHLYEIPPRFQRRPNTESVGNDLCNLNSQSIGSHIRTGRCSSPVDRRSPTYKEMLEDYAATKNLGSLIFKTLSMHTDHRLIQVATVKIKDKTFSSYPKELYTVEEAQEEAAKNAINKLGLQNSEKKSKKRVSADLHAVLLNIRVILDAHPNGIINTQVPIEYSEKFNENLPDLWLDMLIQNEMIKIEKCDKERSILYPFINQYKLENGVGIAGSETSSSSGSHSANQGQTSQSSTPFPSKLQLPEDNYWDVFITYITSTTDIAFRLVGKDYSEKYEEMANEIDIFYSDEENCIPVSSVQEGKLYAAKVDESWHRVEVNAITDNNVVCTFVDHGDNECIPIEKLYILQDQFHHLPYQVLHCQLIGLEDYSKISHAFVYLMENILGQTLVAEVTSREDPISVILFDTTTEEDVNVNEKLLNILNEDRNIFEVGKISEVEITHITGKGEIYIRPQEQCVSMLADTLNEVEEKIESYPIPKALSKDKLYLAKYSIDSKWYRALVVNEKGEEVTIYFVDYGNEDTVFIKDIREMESCRSIFTNLPHQAVKCNLDQLPPTSMEWTDKAFERLLELTTNVDTILMKTIKERNDENIPVVELFKRLDNMEIVSINNTLALDKRLFKKLVMETSVPNIAKLELMGSTPSHIRSSVPVTDVETSVIGSCGDGSAISPLETYFLKPPDIPDVGGKFDGHITMAVSPWNFVCQPWNTVYDLECLTVNMQTYYDNEDNKVEICSQNIGIGKLFACKHHVDKLWYRVEVKGKDISGSSLSVYFVDFGDTAIVTCSDLQPLALEFHELPYQAIFCKLSGITPLDGDWRPEDCVRFQSVVVEKEFVVLVTDKIIDSTDTISLEVELIDVKDPNNDVNIGRILIEENRAVLC